MGDEIRVVMLGTYPIDAGRIWGGVQAAYAYLVKGLAQQPNLDIHILSLKSGGIFETERVIGPNLTIHFLSHYPRFERLRNYRNYQSIINQKLKEIQPDLIHAQDAASDALVALRSGFPTVVTVHGIRWEDGKHYSSLNQRIRTLYDSMRTEQYVMRHARHLIAISRYVTNFYQKILRPDIQIYYVPNAIDDRFFKINGISKTPVVLFAGRVIPRKRVMDLVHSFAQVHAHFPGVHLHIAGETTTEPDYVESIRRWIHEVNLDEYVHLLGSLAEDQILQEFSDCSILALPSAQETAPMVIAQAMAVGKPVVATSVGGVPEMIGPDGERGFLVNVGNTDGMAAMLLRLLENPDLCVKIGERARAFAQANYQNGNVGLRTLEIYRYIAFKEYPAHV